MHVVVDCSVADPGKAPGGPVSLIFRPKWDPKGRKNVFVDRPSPFSKGLNYRPPSPYERRTSTGLSPFSFF